jgi:hypothetical protein
MDMGESIETTSVCQTAPLICISFVPVSPYENTTLP